MSRVKDYNDFMYHLNMDEPDDLYYRLASRKDESETIDAYWRDVSINGRNNVFYAIHDIRFFRHNQKQGRLKNIVDILEQKDFSVMFHNVINPILERYLQKRGWTAYSYRKNGGIIKCLFKQ